MAFMDADEFLALAAFQAAVTNVFAGQFLAELVAQQLPVLYE